MSELAKYRLAARCEAAGRPNNEDNFHINADIAAGSKQFKGDEVLNLGTKGAVLVVCDGMGGMNAGEVASAIAVKTINEWFDTNRINNDVLATDATRCEYIKNAIQAADANIKKESKADEAKSGMGSTIVMVWLLESKAYVGWCGDSRAYKYNPNSGLVQMSHDHSYVQELVDSGKLSPELAFDHPNGNIITRSLGDPRGAAQPDVKVFNLEENDEILLCSDGLCGVLRNNEIEKVLQNNTTSMVGSRDALWEAARAAGWHDNVTIIIAQIMPKEAKSDSTPKGTAKGNGKGIKFPAKIKKYALIAACILAIVIGAIYFWPTDNCNDKQLNEIVNQYEQINNPVDIDANLNILDKYFNKINKCPDLIERVDHHTKHLINDANEKIQLDPDGVQKVIQKLESIKNNLKKIES